MKKYSWSTVSLAVSILLVLSVSVAEAEAGSVERPNLILILADDLGHGDLSCHGSTEVSTPHLDRLASEGVMMTHMRANCTVCSPTRAAILTGKYADRAGVPGVIRTSPDQSWGYLDPNLPTLANSLSDAGYHTAIVGKWHLGLEAPNTPLDRGFDHFHGFLGDMMDDYYTHRRGGLNLMRHDRQTIDPPGHATELFTQWSMEYLSSRSEHHEQPFFLYLPYNAPHFPIQPPALWEAKIRQQFPGLTDARIKNVAFVEHLDDQIGRLLQHVDKLGLRENTVIAFTSDNGGSLPHAQNNDPWRGGKQSHYDGGLRVPCFFRYPPEIEAGTKHDSPVLTFDIAATFMAYAGLEIPEDFDAIDMRHAIAGENVAAEREMYFVRREGGPAYGGKAYHAIIKGKWKLLQNDPYSPLELYDLENDPGEKTNLAGEKKGVVRRLQMDISRHIQQGGATAWQPPSLR
mgnify:CR=1 FL=1|tara:strand:- start:260 stop:1636 length:1377 start_codon:yes stop_codon:yes gene_type:complete